MQSRLKTLKPDLLFSKYGHTLISEKRQKENEMKEVRCNNTEVKIMPGGEDRKREPGINK